MSLFIPDLMCDTVYDIPQDYYTENRVKYIFLDIDNTLVSYGTPKPTKENLEWLNKLRSLDITVIFMSNNHYDRVTEYTKGLGLWCVPDVGKPSVKAYKEIIHDFGIDKKHALAVGDQIFTDVFSAKRLGIKAVMVKPVEPVENLFFKFTRLLEKPFVFSYKQKMKREVR